MSVTSRISRKGFCHVAALLMLVAASVTATGAQQNMTMKIEGENLFLFEEFILALEEEDGRVVVSLVPPEDTLPEEYEHVDFEGGDVIRMMNGRRIRSTAEIREIYEKLEPGDEIKLGVRRGEEMFIVAFPRAEPGKDGGGLIIRTVTGDGSGEEDGEE